MAKTRYIIGEDKRSITWNAVNGQQQGSIVSENPSYYLVKTMSGKHVVIKKEN